MNWIKTSEKLPCEIGEQCEVIMWSPGWATWLKCSCIIFMNGSVDWKIFDQQNGEDFDCPETPEYWMHISLDTIKHQ